MMSHQTPVIENPEPIVTQRAPLWFSRLLVLAFPLCFVGFLAALWLSGTLVSVPQQWVSVPFIYLLLQHRLLLLIPSAACVIACYIALRYLTREIMGVSERYLDERQKIARDQAHRSAFRFIKMACFLIPGVFVLMNLPYWHTSNISNVYAFTGEFSYTLVTPASCAHSSKSHACALSTLKLIERFQSLPPQLPFQPPVIPSATPTEIVLAACLLLLCLLLLVSALPMFILAWKGEM